MSDSKLEITAYIHCHKCLAELPLGTSPKEWSRTQTGLTPTGVQVWCNRHEINVMNLDVDVTERGNATTPKHDA